MDDDRRADRCAAARERAALLPGHRLARRAERAGGQAARRPARGATGSCGATARWSTPARSAGRRTPSWRCTARGACPPRRSAWRSPATPEVVRRLHGGRRGERDPARPRARHRPPRADARAPARHARASGAPRPRSCSARCSSGRRRRRAPRRSARGQPRRRGRGGRLLPAAAVALGRAPGAGLGGRAGPGAARRRGARAPRGSRRSPRRAAPPRSPGPRRCAVPRTTSARRTPWPSVTSSRSPGRTSLLGLAARPLTWTRPPLTASAAIARVLTTRAAHSHLSTRTGAEGSSIGGMVPRRGCEHARRDGRPPARARHPARPRAGAPAPGRRPASPRWSSGTAPAARSPRRTCARPPDAARAARVTRRARRAALPRRRAPVAARPRGSSTRPGPRCVEQLRAGALGGLPRRRRRPLLRARAWPAGRREATGAAPCCASPSRCTRRAGRRRGAPATRLPELEAVRVPVLVVQGARDPFGMPPAGPRRTVAAVAGDHRLADDLAAVGAAVGDWLARVV